MWYNLQQKKSLTVQVGDGAQNVHHLPWWTMIGDDATEEWLPQWRDPTWLTPFSVAVSVGWLAE